MAQEDDMITLAMASQSSGVPVEAMRKAIKQGRMWGTRKNESRGPVWYTTPDEVARYRKLYRPQVKK